MARYAPCSYSDTRELTDERSTKRIFAQDLRSCDDSIITTDNKTIAIPERTSSFRENWPIIAKLRVSSGHVFSEIPVLRSTPWEAQRKQKAKKPTRHPLSPSAISSHIFNQLPTVVYHVILEQLILLHVRDKVIDAVGVLRDLRACCLVNKRWLHPARDHLYYNLWLLQNEPSKKRKYGLKRSKSRLEFLLRTLVEERSLAQMVHRVSITPSLQRELLTPKSFLSRSRHALDLLREMVELCPALEQIDGFLPELAPQYANFFQTMLRRPRLKSLVWWTHLESWFTIDLDRLSQYEHSWQHLHTLVLSQGNSSKSMSTRPGSILRLLQQTPALRSLMLAGLSRKDVNDDTLQLLPALSRLRLDDLVGVTDKGIISLCESENASSLRSLTLSALKVQSMKTISSVLDHCHRLERLRFVQMEAPEWYLENDIDTVLESGSLWYLHWETLVPGNASKAFADAIVQGAFPKLGVIKAPCDHEGHLQAVCRPIHEQELTPDDIKFMERGRLHGSSYSIRLAQLRAQLRVQEQRRHPTFNFVVEDEDEELQHTDVIGAYLGQLDSRIEYRLEPDIPGSTLALSHLSDFLEPEKVHEQIISMTSSDTKPGLCPAYSYDLLF